MKKYISNVLFFSILLFLSSCSSFKKKANNEMTRNQPSAELNMWLNSERMPDVAIGTTSSNCFAVNYDQDLERNDLGIPADNWRTFCGTISGFDYEVGNIYQLKVRKNKTIFRHGVDQSEWQLIEILSKEKDRYYEKVETHTVWIGPKLIQVACASPLAPVGCKEMRHQVQRGNFDRDGGWTPMYDFYEIRDYEEGYLYQVRYTKRYNPDAFMVMDGDDFKIEEFEILEKKRF